MSQRTSEPVIPGFRNDSRRRRQRGIGCTPFGIFLGARLRLKHYLQVHVVWDFRRGIADRVDTPVKR